MKLRKIGLSAFINLLAAVLMICASPVSLSVLILQVSAQTPYGQKAEAERLLQQGWEQLRASRFEAAIQLLQQALIIFQAIGDKQQEGNTLNSLGISYYQIRYYSKAIEFYKQSLAITREIKNRPGEMSVLINLGRAYYSKRDDYTAIDYYLLSLKIARELTQRREEGAILLALGNVALSAREYPGAITFYEKSLAIVRQLNDLAGEEIIINNFALVYDSIMSYSSAAKYYEESLKILKKIRSHHENQSSINTFRINWGSRNNYQNLLGYFEPDDVIARQIYDRGSSHLLGSSPNSEQLFSLSSHQIREIKYREREVITLLNLGRIYRSMSNYSKAINSYEQGLTIAREIKDKLREGIALNNLGKIFFESKRLREAEKFLRDGIEVWESLREKLDDHQKVLVFEEQAHTYRYLQKVLITDNRHREALEIAERGRARAFVALLTKRIFSPSDRLSPVNSPSLDKIQQIAKTQKAILVEYSIMYKEDEIINEGSNEAEIYIWVVKPNGETTFRRSNLSFQRQQQNSFVGDGVVVRSQFQPGGERVWLQQNTSLAVLIPRIRQSIGVRGNEIAFKPGDRIHFKGDNPNTEPWEVVSFDPQSGILMVRHPSFATTSVIPKSINDVEDFGQTSLQQLHQILIEPIADLLPKNPSDRIIFIPQGELFLVPFAALQDKEGKYLMEKHTILTAPSIQVLDLTRKQRQRVANSTAKDALVVGNPSPMPKPFTPLEYAAPEAKAIANLLNTNPIIGTEATESAIVAQMPNARIIHLATHGLFDDIRGLGSAIALAPSDKDDGLLTAEEILNLKLNAELVVLSACDTGRGRLTGDGVIGLSRSLISAGVPSVIVSLWRVPDNTTAGLMVEFYRQLKGNPDKAQALRQAMLTTLKQHPNPRDWAAFTLIGEAE